MKRYEVNDIKATFPSGTTLFLDARQFKARAYAMALTKKGKPARGDKNLIEAIALAPVEFKRGEVIGIPGELTPAMACVLVEAESRETDREPGGRDKRQAVPGGADESRSADAAP